MVKNAALKNAVLWQWAKDQGLTPKDLAEKMGYKSAVYVEQVIRGWEKVSHSFIGRFVVAYPDHAHIVLERQALSDDRQGSEP